MKIKFFGEPNSIVKRRVKRPLSAVLEFRPLFRFDKNGEYILESDDTRVIQSLKRKFAFQSCEGESVPVELKRNDEPRETIRRCKKCEFTCTNQGELLAHYRTAHPKREG